MRLSTKPFISFCIAVISLLAVCGEAFAAGTSVEQAQYQVERMNPGTGAADYIDLLSPMVVDNLDFNAGGFVSYSQVPLREKREASKYTPVLLYQTTISPVASLGLFNFMEVGFMLPITIQGKGSGVAANLQSDFKQVGIGDPRLSLKFQIFHTLKNSFGLGSVVNVYFPLGTKNSYLSDGGVSVEGLILGEYNVFHNIRIAANVGYRWRQNSNQFLKFQMKDEIPWAVGVVVPLWFSSFDFLAELDGAVNLGSNRSGYSVDANQSSIAREDGQSPVEGRLAARWGIMEHLTFTVGVGTGVNTAGVGVPQFRFFLGLDGRWVLTDRYARNIDYDADNLVGDADQCPEAAEDYDGFQDDDGCPEWDNDEDGVEDSKDKCPNTPKGSTVDANGCPLVSNTPSDVDQDGIPDDKDKCPDDPEDKDGFQDDDGCPEWDNDEDGIPDNADKCPNKAENFNNFQDDDGCPDDPNARVQVGKDSLIILEQVFFETGKAKIRKVSYSILDEVAKVINENPQILLIEVQGHTDNVGNDKKNMRLSQARAEAVRDFLIEQGVDPSRLSAKGYGETKPIDDNNTKEGRAKNRRVEFKMLKMKSDD